MSISFLFSLSISSLSTNLSISSLFFLSISSLPAYFNSSALLLTRQWVTGGATIALEVPSIKGAGSFHDIRKSMKKLCANDTSRYPKVLKIGPNHGCQ